MGMLRHRTVEVVVGVRVTDTVHGHDLFSTSVVERADDRGGTTDDLHVAVMAAGDRATEQVEQLVRAYGAGRRARGEA